MAKNETKTIFNTLQAKARVKKPSNSDKKEVRRAINSLATELKNGYTLSVSDVTTLKSTFTTYQDEINDTFRQMNTEEQIALRGALEKTLQSQNNTEETKEEVVVINTNDVEDNIIIGDKDEAEDAIIINDNNDEKKQPTADNEINFDAPIPEANSNELNFTPTEEKSVITPSTDDELQPKPYNFDVLNKKPQEMTADDREELEKILNNANRYAPEYARAATLLGELDALTHSQPETEKNQTAPKDEKEAEDEKETEADKSEEKNESEKDNQNNEEIITDFENETPNKPEVEPASPEEVNKYLNEVRNSSTMTGYLASIPFKLKPAMIEASMAFEKIEDRAIALANPDDLLVTSQYYEQNKSKDHKDVDTVIIYKLNSLNPDDITPDNAYVWLALADKVKNDSIYSTFTQKIADALKKYDAEKFGTKLSETELANNYADAVKALKNFEPTQTDKNGKTIPTLSAFTFTDDKGNELYDRDRGALNPARWVKGKGNEASANKKAILDMARELAAQELAKTGLDKDPKKRQEQLNKAVNEQLDKLLADPDGKKTFSKNEMAGRLAVAHNEGETFKTRVTQHFTNSKWGKTLSARIKTLDKQLTETYGNNYVKAKKYTKIVANVGKEVFKGACMFAAAGLIQPVGVPALIAYNTYKQWKTIGPILKSSDIPAWKKRATTLTAIGTTTLGAIAGASGVSSIISATGLDNPAFLQNLTNIGCQLGIMGRTAISTSMAVIPNRIEHTLLKNEEKKLAEELKQLAANNGNPPKEKMDAFNKKTKELEEKLQQAKEARQKGGSLKNILANFVGSNDKKIQKLEKQLAKHKADKPKNATEIMQAQKILQQKLQQNNDQLLISGLSTGLGVGLAQSGLIPNLLHQGIETVKEHMPSIDASTPPGSNQYNQTTVVGNQSVYDPDGAIERSLAHAPDGTIYHKDLHSQSAHDELLGIKPETDLKANFEAAKVENSSGIEGKSSYAHTLAHLSSLDGMDGEKATQMADKLSQQLGAKANTTTIACKMAPYALQEALGLDLGGKNPTTNNMLNYISEHGIPADKMDNFNKFMNENFEGAHFKAENFANYQNNNSTNDSNDNNRNTGRSYLDKYQENRAMDATPGTRDGEDARKNLRAQLGEALEKPKSTFARVNRGPQPGAIEMHVDDIEKMLNNRNAHKGTPVETKVVQVVEQHNEVIHAPYQEQVLVPNYGHPELNEYAERNRCLIISCDGRGPKIPETYPDKELYEKLNHNIYSGIFQTYHEETVWRNGHQYTKYVEGPLICVPHNPNKGIETIASHELAIEMKNHGVGKFGKDGPSLYGDIYTRSCYGTGGTYPDENNVFCQVSQALRGLGGVAEGIGIFVDAVKGHRGHYS